MSADPLEHKVPRHVPGEQYEKAYDLANRRGKQVIELRQKLDAAEAALASTRRDLEAHMDAAKVREAALAESRGEVERLRKIEKAARKMEEDRYSHATFCATQGLRYGACDCEFGPAVAAMDDALNEISDAEAPHEST